MSVDLITRVGAKLPALTKVAGAAKLAVQAKSPQILFAVGLAAGVATVVAASKATLKLEPTLQDIQYRVEDVNALWDITPESEISGGSRKKDLLYVYATGAYDITRLYAPAVLFGALSVACLTKSHTLLLSRNAGLSAAYAALDQSYQAYRERVRGELGPEREQELFTKNELEILKNSYESSGEINVYTLSRVFDVDNPAYNPRIDLNPVWLRHIEQFMNDKLHAQGHLFLNEVYDALSFDRVPEGQQLGWLSKNPDGTLNHVSFGPLLDTMYTTTDELNKSRFEMQIPLTFNVQGVIFDKIGKWS